MQLPPEMIVSWENGVIEGLDSLPEDDFRIEYAKNDAMLAEWLEKKAALAVSAAEAAKWSRVVSKAEAKLFEEFKAKRGKK